MPELAIDKKTRWECQMCGDCCRDVVLTKNKNLSIIKDGKAVCKFFDEKNNRCLDYNNRPFICKSYPFVIDMDKVVDENGTARPQQAFKLENLKIHSECPGFGKGKRIYANKNLHRKFDKMALEFAVNFKKAFNKEIDVDEVI